MADLSTHDVIDTDGIAVILILRFSLQDYMLALGGTSSVEAYTHNCGGTNTYADTLVLFQ
jgi:hypothetical protein